MHKKKPPFDWDDIVKSLPDKSIYHLGVYVKPETALFLGRAAHLAAVAEIMTKPKPGLVDPLGSGCHKDMDWRLLLASAEALAPFWPKQAGTGLEGVPPESAMPQLRALGMEMDRAMFAAAGGVNAHKGLIYAMSLLLYGAGYALYNKNELTPRAVTGYAAAAVRGSVERELAALLKDRSGRRLTNGEKLFLKHGVTGIRGEAEKGFPSITEAGLPELHRALAEGAGENDAALCALLAIMEANEDSNVIHRGGFDFWKNEYREMVAQTREKFIPGSGNYSAIEELEKAFLPRCVSPGGAADLLACTLFLNFVTNSTCQH